MKTFTGEELKRFGEFLHSPFHNKNKKAIHLFELLIDHHPVYDSDKLNREYLFSEIFESKKFNDASLRNLLSDLLILAEKFLAHLRLEKDLFEITEKYLLELIERRLTGLLEKKINSCEGILNVPEFEGESNFYKKFIFEELKSSGVQFSDNLKLYKHDSNTKASEYLSYYFLIKVFKMLNYFAFQKQYNISSHSNLAYKLIKNLDIAKIIDEEKNKQSNSHKILLVYFKMFKSIDNPSDAESYFEFKKVLQENENLFAPLEKYSLYVCLTNSCVQRIDLGNEEFFKECFEVNKIMCEKNLYSVYPGYFPMTAYITYLNTGLAAGETDKVESFINEYSVKLNPEHKKAALSYALAQVNFYRKNFAKAVELASSTETDFFQFKFLLKILSLKSYYELNDFESLYYACDSFKHFIGKNKAVGENYKIEFNNFIAVLERLVKLKTGKNEKISFEIKNRLSNKSIASRKWLEEKFRELELK